MEVEGKENKETKPLTSDHSETGANNGNNMRRNSSHERRMFRPGSSASQLALAGAGSSSIALGSLGNHGSRGQIRSSASGGNVSGLRSRTPSGKSIVSRVVPVAEYHQDLKPSLAQGMNRNLFLLSFIIVLSTSYQFGYNIGVLNQPVKLIQLFYNESYTASHCNAEEQSVDNFNGTFGYNCEPMDEYTLTFLWSLTTTLFVIGGMVGAYVAGFVANKLGRKRAVLVSCIPAIIGAILSACCQAAGSIAMLMIGRVITGINCGLATQLGPMFLLEIAPFNLKGAFGTAHQLFITVGIFMGAVLGLREILGTKAAWPYLLLLNAVPAIVCLVVMPFLPDSPRYLMLVRGNRTAATKALQFIRRREDVEVDLEEMETEMKGTGGGKGGNGLTTVEEQEDEKHSLNHIEGIKKADDTDEFTMTRLLKTRQLYKPLFIAMFLQVIQQLSGINAIFFYSTGIYKNAGVADVAIQYAVLITNAVNVLMTIIAVPIMDKAGRRLLLLIPMGAMVLVLALITIALNLQAQLQWMSYVSIGCVLAYVICFAVGLGPIPPMIGAELFRQGPRPYAMSLAGLTNWVFTAIVAISFELVQKVTKEYTFIIFLVLMIGFVIFVAIMVPETKNKTFEEIASEWQKGENIEVEEVVDDPIYTGNDFNDSEIHNIRDLTATQDDERDDKWAVGDGLAAVFAPDITLKMPNEKLPADALSSSKADNEEKI